MEVPRHPFGFIVQFALLFPELTEFPAVIDFVVKLISCKSTSETDALAETSTANVACTPIEDVLKRIILEQSVPVKVKDPLATMDFVPVVPNLTSLSPVAICNV